MQRFVVIIIVIVVVVTVATRNAVTHNIMTLTRPQQGLKVLRQRFNLMPILSILFLQLLHLIPEAILTGTIVRCC